ncbi:uncharacterized protein LOC129749974 [Uranotaenia lowii]|uniref:uncharacterized protein LOC129749974 n=1 Tax=Uranotaenia lowii TaxID=190385 RepID=UPI0024794769|nr:uncharacterized protein LOC129749974 [Uranotaenia lowii]
MARVTKIICADQPYKYTLVHKCFLKVVRNSPTEMTILAELIEPQPVALFRFDVYYKLTSYQKFSSFDFDVDLCKYYKDGMRSDNFIVNYTLGNLLEELPSFKCPLSGNFSINRYVAGRLTYPSIFPDGEYRFDLLTRRPDNVTLFYLQYFATWRNKMFIR